jgi:hypothetical protein
LEHFKINHSTYSLVISEYVRSLNLSRISNL